LTDAVYGFIGHDGDPNHGFVITEKGVVVIDNDIRFLGPFMEALRSTTPKEIKFLINTHHAFDHASANQLFAEKGVPIIASAACREHMAAVGEEKFAEMRAREERVREGAKGIAVVLPDITFDERLSLHLGAHLLELIFVGHCHSPGDIIIYLPREKIVFVGDLLLYKCHPNVRQGNIDNWCRALELIYELPVETIVPGHGGIIPGKEECLVVKEYFIKVRSKIEEEARRGKRGEDIKREFSLPEYGDWGKTRWLTATIEKVYREYKGG